MSAESSQPGSQDSKGLAEVSRGAVTLLAIAQENDKHKKIATNLALRLSLEYIGKLPALCKTRDDQAISSLLGRAGLPEKWFEFCVALVVAIESDLAKMKDPERGFSLQTDFDRS